MVRWLRLCDRRWCWCYAHGMFHPSIPVAWISPRGRCCITHKALSHNLLLMQRPDACMNSSLMPFQPRCVTSWCNCVTMTSPIAIFHRRCSSNRALGNCKFAQIKKPRGCGWRWCGRLIGSISASPRISWARCRFITLQRIRWVVFMQGMRGPYISAEPRWEMSDAGETEKLGSDQWWKKATGALSYM